MIFSISQSMKILLPKHNTNCDHVMERSDTVVTCTLQRSCQFVMDDWESLAIDLSVKINLVINMGIIVFDSQTHAHHTAESNLRVKA